MQERVYKAEIKVLDDLKRRLIAELSGLQQSIISMMLSISGANVMRSCVKMSGRHFEHLL